MSDATPRGHFVWYDLMTTDPEAAQVFYTKLIGWGTTEWQGPTPYTMWTNNEMPLGGVMTLPVEARQQGAPPHWRPYISTPDVDKTFSQATGLGATGLVSATDIPTVGRFSVIADPQGAIFAAFTFSEKAPVQEGPPQIGQFSWHELATTDYQAAFDFYHQLFGWQKTEAMDMGEAGTYQMYGKGDEWSLGGIYNKPAEMPISAWLLYVKIEDVNEGIEVAKDLGGQILNGPMEVPGGDLVAQCLDPQGAAFALHSSKA